MKPELISHKPALYRFTTVKRMRQIFKLTTTTQKLEWLSEKELILHIQKEIENVE